MKKLIFFSIISFIASISTVSASDNSTDSLVADCDDSDILQRMSFLRYGVI